MAGKTLRDQLRAATVGSKRVFKSEVVEVEVAGGQKLQIEVRQMSIKERSEYFKASNDVKDNKVTDIVKMQVNGIISSCYVPGTDEKVFDMSDYDVLSQSVTGGFADKIWEKIQELQDFTLEKAKKN